MPRASYKCSKCTRKFSMPAHLARHMNTIHARKTRAKSAQRKVSKGRVRMARSVATASRRPNMAIAGFSSDATSHLLGEMRNCQSELLTQRTSLDAEINGLARAMEALGGTGRAAPGRKKVRLGRPPAKTGFREGSLKSFIVKVLSQNSKPLSPNDIGNRVVKAGFKTKAKDITKAVSNTIPQLKRIKKVGFGMYTVR